MDRLPESMDIAFYSGHEITAVPLVGEGPYHGPDGTSSSGPALGLPSSLHILGIPSFLEVLWRHCLEKPAFDHVLDDLGQFIAGFLVECIEDAHRDLRPGHVAVSAGTP